MGSRAHYDPQLDGFPWGDPRAEAAAKRKAALAAWEAEKPPEGMPRYRERQWWEEHRRRKP